MNPAHAISANLSRLSYNASIRAHSALRRAASRLTAREVMKLSLAFTFPWFAGNYCYQHALEKTEAAIVNVLSASSCIFTLLLAGAFPSEPGDKITVSKIFAVCFNFSGVILVSYADINDQSSQENIPIGVVWAIFGAFFYSVYIVLLRRKVQNEDNMDPPMFFGLYLGLSSIQYTSCYCGGKFRMKITWILRCFLGYIWGFLLFSIHRVIAEESSE